MSEILTSIAANSEIIHITEGRGYQNEEGDFIRVFHTTRGNGGSYCDLLLYPDGKVYSTVSPHGDETAQRLCSALARRLGVKNSSKP